MLGVVGVIAQELVHPEQLWYRTDQLELPFDIRGLVAVELFLFHWWVGGVGWVGSCAGGGEGGGVAVAVVAVELFLLHW